MSDPYLQKALEGKRPATAVAYTGWLTKALALTSSADSYKLMMGRGRVYDAMSRAWLQESPSTLKGVVAVINTIIRTNPGLAPEALEKYWAERLVELHAVMDALAADKTASKALSAKWMPYDDIRTKVDDLVARGPAATLKDSQELVLLAVYAYLPPMRANLGKLRIVKSGDELEEEENGVVVPHDGVCSLVLNEFKDKFVEELPTELEAVVRASLAAFQRTHLLVGPNDTPVSATGYGKRVSAVMDKYFERRLSINDLRHMYAQKVSAE